MNASPARSSTSNSPAPGLITRLALADLRHEWILTLCLILAISAVIAPLLLLFGLKYGTIETLRFRLIQDPKNREIRPLTSATFARDWFPPIAARDDVAFLIPMTRQISSSVSAWIKNTAGGELKKGDLDLAPTGPGDALILENGAPIPRSGECVLSAFAAETIGAKAGDMLVIQAARTKGSRRETGEMELRVAGVLTLRAGTLRTLFVPLDILEQVEAFKDGQAVPELGWEGTRPEAYPLYDGALVATPEELSVLMQRKLSANSGFTRTRPLDAPESQSAELGYQLADSRRALLLHTETKPIGAESLTILENHLRGYEAILLPWVRNIPAMLTSREGATLPLSLRILPAEAARIHTRPAPPWNDPLAGGSNLLTVGIQAGAMTGSSFRIVCSNETGALEFPVRLIEMTNLPANTAYVQSRLGGILRLAASRPIRYEEATGEFLLYRRGYAGFRLYAARIEDVDTLRQFFESEGIPVHTEAGQIQTVMEMDRYLTLIFWLVAAVGIGGSVASLVASLYASVERKKKELSVLRLIGLSGMQLYRFPIYQGAVIAAGAFGAALLFFSAIAHTINRLFASHLQAGESFCRLPTGYIALACAGTVAVACLAAIAAVIRLARIDPAEALRDE